MVCVCIKVLKLKKITGDEVLQDKLVLFTKIIFLQINFDVNSETPKQPLLFSSSNVRPGGNIQPSR